MNKLDALPRRETSKSLSCASIDVTNYDIPHNNDIELPQIPHLSEIENNVVERNSETSYDSTKSIWKIGKLKIHSKVIKYGVHTITAGTLLTYSLITLGLTTVPSTISLSLLFFSIGLLCPTPSINKK